MNIRNKILIGNICWLTGSFLAYICFNENCTYNCENTTSIPNNLSGIDIFINNFEVGMLMALGGYISYGIIPCIVLLYNGYIIQMLINHMLTVLDMDEIFYNYFLHAPFEIFALLIYAAIGLNGIKIYHSLWRGDAKALKKIIQLRTFILPTILLCIAAIIESN